MRNISALLLCFAVVFTNAQNNVPVSTLPGVDTLGQNDFFPVVQGGHYHKAFIWQLPSGGGCACSPAGGAGYVQYNGPGTFGSDSLFTRNPLTGNTTIAYYDSVQNKTGEQIGNIGGVLDGAANQIFDPVTYNYAMSGVVDAAKLGVKSLIAVMGVGNLKTFEHHGFVADTGGAGIITDSLQVTVSGKGIAFGWNNGSYVFPASNGLNGQVLTTNGNGALSWQTIGTTATPPALAVPTGAAGSVPYAGATAADTLFTRNPATLQTSISYYENADAKIGEQIQNVAGVFNGAANQMYQPSSGNYAVAGVLDVTPMGGFPLTAVVGVMNPAQQVADVISADTTGVQMQYNTLHFGISTNGLYYKAAKGSYIFPNYQGANNQVLSTDSNGNLSWQNVSNGFINTGIGAVQYGGQKSADSLFTRNPATMATTIAYNENGYKTGLQVSNVLGGLPGAATQIYEPVTRNYAVNGVFDLSANGKGIMAMMGFLNGSDTLGNLVMADSVKTQLKYHKSILRLDTTGLTYNWPGGSMVFPHTSGSSGQVLTADGAGNLTWQSPAVTANTVVTSHVSISQAQILNMVSSPIQLIPAPGAGKFIQVLGITGRLNFNSQAYIDTPLVSMGYSYNTGISAYFDTSNMGLYNSYNLLTDTQTTYSVFSIGATTFAADNAPLLLTVYDKGPVATNPYGGDGTMDIYITYTIVNE